MTSPQFSVVMATRDRPALFAEALASVLAQRDVSIEVIVVNDGSNADAVAAYQPVWARARAQLGDRFQVHHLVHRPRGHGQSYSLNFGVAQASGRHVCFLDDDDYWTDDGHLARAATAIAAADADGRGEVDLYMANQSAWISPDRPVGTLWLGQLAAQLQATGRQPDILGCYQVDVPDLMACDGFCHVNCLVVRRALFQLVGGMDESIRWECDRDLYLKLVEAAGHMLHHPAVVSYHRVPDPAKAVNMTTALPMVDKRLLQSIVLDRALLRSRHPSILRHARQHKGYALKRIAEELARAGRWPEAALYARQALGAAPGPGWAARTLHYWVRSLGNGR
jgi:glycosyltransferase involved in cell wall biosynthesis